MRATPEVQLMHPNATPRRAALHAINSLAMYCQIFLDVFTCIGLKCIRNLIYLITFLPTYDYFLDSSSTSAEDSIFR